MSEEQYVANQIRREKKIEQAVEIIGECENGGTAEIVGAVMDMNTNSARKWVRIAREQGLIERMNTDGHARRYRVVEDE